MNSVTDRDERAALRYEIMTTSMDFDQYAWAMSWRFAIAENLYLSDPDAVPEAWHFEPPRIGTLTVEAVRDGYEGSTVFALVADGCVSSATLVYWGNVLSRYTDRLTAAGLDY